MPRGHDQSLPPSTATQLTQRLRSLTRPDRLSNSNTMTRLSAALLALPAFALAQYNNGGSSSKGTKTAAKATMTPTASSSSSGSIHSIAVGEGGQLKFSPDSIMAKVGDQVEFHFMAAGHSVGEGDFTHPCQPMDSSAWFSGYPVPSGVSSSGCMKNWRGILTAVGQAIYHHRE